MGELENNTFRELYSALSEDNQKVVERLLNGLGAERLKKARRRLNRLALNAYKRGVPLGDDEAVRRQAALVEKFLSGGGEPPGEGERGTEKGRL